MTVGAGWQMQNLDGLYRRFRAQAKARSKSYLSGWLEGSCGLSVGSEERFLRRLAELGGGVGAAMPAVSEPNPSFWRVNASNLPVGVRPLAVWNCFMAPTVESSHLPVGVPVKTPFLAKASWISEMRSGVGAACPFTFLACLPDFLEPLCFPEAEEEVAWEVCAVELFLCAGLVLAGEVPCAATTDTLSAPAATTARSKPLRFLLLGTFHIPSQNRVVTGRLPEPHPVETPSSDDPCCRHGAEL